MSGFDVYDVYDVEDGIRCASQWCVWKDSVDPVPFLLEFHAASNPKGKLHWIALKEVPGAIARIGNLTGRRVKDSDGQWVAPVHTSHGGKARGSSSSGATTTTTTIIWTSWTSCTARTSFKPWNHEHHMDFMDIVHMKIMDIMDIDSICVPWQQ